MSRPIRYNYASMMYISRSLHECRQW